MKFSRFFLFALPLIFPSPSQAQNPSHITNPDTGTFPVTDTYSHPKKQGEDQQLEMQREEEKLDSFGNDKFNENVEPDSLKVDEEKKDKSAAP